HEEIVTRNVFASTSEKAALGTRDFRPIALGAKHASAVISPEWMPQIGVATLRTSVFHSWHDTAFDLAVSRRVSRYNGGRHDKLRFGGQGDKRTRGRSSSSTRHRQGEPLRFTVFRRKRPRHDVRWRRRRHAHGDGARAAFPKPRECV